MYSGSTQATLTDTNSISILWVNQAKYLCFLYVGHETRELKIADGTSVKMTLNALATNLNEVVVTGYESERIKDIAGSVSIVKPKELLAVPAGQVEQMLQGRVAGLSVITTGEPGSESIIRLHGIGNFGDTKPLYIVDGVQADINSLNPYDIESIQVLKDAGAYAIYGVRGANGVIVATTRKGKIGKPTIAFDFYIGETFPIRRKRF